MIEEPIKEALEFKNDVVKNVLKELIEVNLNKEGKESMVKIRKSLLEEERRRLIALLKEYEDVFGWDYEEMPGLDAMVVTHKLNVDPKARPVKQPPRKYRLDVEEKIMAEVNKF